MPGPGGRQLVDAPARLGPVISLLTSVEQIVPADLGSNADRWLNGIHYRSEPCENGNAGPVGCVTVDGDDHTFSKDEDRTGEERATDPFLVYVGETCSTFGWSANDYVGRALRRLAAVEAWQVEREFWTGTAAKAGISAGVAYPTDQWLAQAETSTVLAGSPWSARRGMGVLQEALGNCAGGGRGMIHVPAVLLPTLMEAQLIRRDGNRYLDGLDNVVVIGTGYPGTSVAAASPTAGAAWVFATGMVRIYRTEPILTPNTMAEAVDKSTNTVTFRGERFYLVDWDRCCHFAVQITAT